MRIGVSALDLRKRISITVRSHWLGFVVGILQPHAAELLLGGGMRPSRRFVLLPPHLSLPLVEGRNLQDIWNVSFEVPRAFNVRARFDLQRQRLCSAAHAQRLGCSSDFTLLLYCIGWLAFLAVATDGRRNSMCIPSFTARWAGGAEMPVTAKRKGGVRLAW